MTMILSWGRLVLAAVSLVLAGCAGLPSAVERPANLPEDPQSPVVATDAGGMQRLPGKRETLYRPAQRLGQPCLHARAERSASLWRMRLQAPRTSARLLRFSWWAADLDERATVAQTDSDDAVARVVLAFDGDLSRLNARNRMLFDLAHTLTGEMPPYATLMYVWDAQAPVGSVIVSSRSDRIRKIVVESGRGQLNGWRHYERDVRADFERAFGEPSGPLTSLAYMTDADNTQGRAEACYGPARLF